MLFVSHESKLYGAPLSLLYMMQWFATRAEVRAVTIGEGGFAERLRRDGIDVTVLESPADYRPGLLAKTFDVLRRQLGKLVNIVRIARIARTAGADLIYVNSVSRLSSIAGAWLARKHVVVHVREVENYLEPDSPVRRWLLRQILKMPDRFIADSDASRRVLRRVNPSADVVVVNNGVDPEVIASSGKARTTGRKRLGLDPEKTIVGFVGKRSIRKGFDVFREAAHRVRAENASVQIVVIGDRHPTVPDEGPRIPGLIEVPFLDDISGVYVAMDVFVMASRQEPFARVNLEAAAAGCAIIATAVDGNLELFTHEKNALLVPAGDAEAMTEAITRLVEDREFRQRLGRAARKLVCEHYTLEICHRKIRNAIEDLVPRASVFEEPMNQ